MCICSLLRPGAGSTENRATFLKSSIATIAGTALSLTSVPGLAKAPQVKRQVSGFYRMMLGDFEITALSDGTFTLPMDTLFTNTTPAAVRRALASVHLNAHVETSFNAFLINTGTRLVLVDTGAANTLGPTLGLVLTNLKAAGYHPDQIDEVFLTHAHLDHVGGLVVEGKRAFRNATVHLDKREAAFWLNRGNARFVPKAAQSSFQVATAALHPYASEGKVKLFDGNAQLLPGITAIAAHGHTPGHTLFV